MATAARKSSHLLCLLALITLVNPSPVTHTLAQNQDAPQIDSEIKKAARKLVETNSLVVRKPYFDFIKDGNKMDFYLGGVRPALIGVDADDPYSRPFQKQIQVEALRKLFGESVPSETFWQPILAQQDQTIQGMLSDIESTADAAELKNKLDAREEQFTTQLGQLQLEIAKYARRQGYRPNKVGPREPASDSYEVPIVKNPANGKVQVLPYLKYIQCSATRRCGDVWPWRELVSEKENMIGPYYYRAEWPGGRKNEGLIEVRNATAITFMPSN